MFFRTIVEQSMLKEKLVQSESYLRQREVEVVDCKDSMARLNDTIQNMLKEKEFVNKHISDLEQRLAQHQQSEFEALQKAKELMEMLDNVKYDRDSIRTSEENKKKEITSLEDKIKQLKSENLEKIKKLGKELDEQYGLKIKAAEEEYKQYQLDHAHLKSQLDKAVREKKAAENETLRIMRAAESDQSAPSIMVAELNKKLTYISTEKFDLEKQCENMKSAMKRSQIQFDQERETLNEQLSETNKKVVRLEKEIAEVRASKERVHQEFDILNKKCFDLHVLKEEQEKQLKDYVALIEEFDEQKRFYLQQIDVANKRADDKADYIKLLLAKEADLLKDKKELHISMDRMNIEMDRVKRELEGQKRFSSSGIFQSVDPRKVLTSDQPYFDILLSNSTRTRKKVFNEPYGFSSPTADEDDLAEKELSASRRRRKREKKKHIQSDPTV